MLAQFMGREKKHHPEIPFCWKSLKGPPFLIKIVGDTFLDDESLKNGG